ncbi:MAG: hypothetical protein AAB580_03940 [Patescibacteria group bacterium]
MNEQDRFDNYWLNDFKLFDFSLQKLSDPVKKRWNEVSYEAKVITGYTLGSAAFFIGVVVLVDAIEKHIKTSP